MRALSLFLTSLLLLPGSVSTVLAQPTHIQVRARSVDAKFIADHIGGGRVIIEDAESGRILDEGHIGGSTGDTKLLMQTPHERGQRLAREQDGGYLASIDIDEPTLVRIRVLAPYGRRQALQEATVTTWVVPGKDITGGDGVVLNMPGLVVDGWTQLLPGGKLNLFADVTMLCGCPITADGVWQAREFEVHALISLNGRQLADVPLKFNASSAIYAGQFTTGDSGLHEVLIYAYQKRTGNTGVTRTQRGVVLDK